MPCRPSRTPRVLGASRSAFHSVPPVEGGIRRKLFVLVICASERRRLITESMARRCAQCGAPPAPSASLPSQMVRGYYDDLSIINFCAGRTALISWHLRSAGVSGGKGAQTSYAASSAGSPILRLITSPLNLEFMAGAAIGIAWKSVYLPFRHSSKIMAALVTLGCLLIAARIDMVESPRLEWLRTVLFGIPSALIVYALCAAEQKEKISVPRLLTSLGDWSYAVYLAHVLILSALGRLIAVIDHGALGAAILIVAGPVAANVGGWALHRFAERPTLTFLYGLWPKTKGAESAPEKAHVA